MDRARAWADKVRRCSSRPGVWLLLLVLVALVYYGSYYRSSLNFRDEGGTVALGAQRLLAGERPFLDIELNYNVLWFYPVEGLYKIFGVNMTVLRVYCFALATLTAVLGFLGVQKVSRRPWLAFLVGLLLVLVPGMTYKNYMPLLAVANSVCLLWFVNPRPSRSGAAEDVQEEVPGLARPLLRLAIGSVVLGLTWLIRIDLGMFFSVLWMGALALQTLDRSRPWGHRLALLIGGPLLAGLIVWGVHLPVYLDARARGFDAQFVQQYLSWPKRLKLQAMERLGIQKKPALAARAEPKATASADKPSQSPQKLNREILKRKSWSDAFTQGEWKDRLLAMLLYAPLLSLIPLILWAVIRVCTSVRDTESDAVRRPLAALLMLGGALTVFPQYFFFRADSSHLSEFSPGFWVAAVSSCVLLGSAGIRRIPTRQWISGILLALLTIHAGYFLSRMLPDRWTGTIAARKGRTQEFHAENGVHVYVTKREKAGLEALLKVIHEHSKPGEYLVAYPYHPTINVLSNRPTYEKNVYVDNATRSKDWDNEAIARFQKFKPAIIALSEWDINSHEASRFSAWALKTKTWVQTHYIYQGTYLEFEIYTRPDQPL